MTAAGLPYTPQDFHIQGHRDPDGAEMTKAIQRAVASYGGVAKIKPFPWWFIYMAAPFRATLREILEMRYLGRQPVRLHISFWAPSRILLLMTLFT